MLDAGANLGARAIVCLLFVRERLVALTFLANVTFIASVLQNLLRVLTAVRTISPHPWIHIVRVDEVVKYPTVSMYDLFLNRHLSLGVSKGNTN